MFYPPMPYVSTTGKRHLSPFIVAFNLRILTRFSQFSVTKYDIQRHIIAIGENIR